MYQHVLVAVDLTEDSQNVFDKARHIAEASGSELSIVHVMQPMYLSYGSEMLVDVSPIEEEMYERVTERFQAFVEKSPIKMKGDHIKRGVIEDEVHELATEINADLVVVGSHGRHGLALLLGSHANGMLHGAKTDVLAVKV